MPWLEVRAHVAASNAETLDAALAECGAISTALEDPRTDKGLFEPTPGTTPLWDTVIVSALFALENDLDALRRCITASVAPHALAPWDVQLLADADWERAWLERFHPIDFGNGLWICPSWHTPPVADATNIILDPGLAFGTGTHATTALCLRWLARQTLADQAVLDYGCGSGVLAIAALLRGAGQAVGVDIDPAALTVAQENAQRNGVAPRLRLVLPASLPADARFDVVIANILAQPLIDLAPTMSRHARERLLLSGLLVTQVDEVAAAYRGWRFTIATQDEWALLIGSRAP